MQNASIFDAMTAEVFGRPEAHGELAWLCDNVGGRTSGTESGDRAEEWASRLLRKWGLERVRYEELPVVVWSRGTLEVQAVEPETWELTAVSHGNSPSSAQISADVVYVRHGERPDFEHASDQVKGAIVLCDEGATPGDRVLHRSEKLGLAVEHGACGLLIESSAHGHLPRTGVCNESEAPIPSVGISLEDGARLRRLIGGGETPVLRLSMTNTITHSTARNVLADLPGNEVAEEVVLAGGHLDSWDVAQGATDNGLGSAIVLEMARVMAALPKRPRRTLRFALWAAEEVGLLGSKYYAQQRSSELSDHVAIMNFDMTGAPVGFWTPGNREPAEVLSRLARRLAPFGIAKPLEYGARLHSDHQPFMLAGVPIVGIESDLRPEGRAYYHSTGDTFDKVSARDLSLAAAVGAHTMWALADAADRPYMHKSPVEVRKMIDDARLYEALLAESYDGPPMHVSSE